MHRASCNLSDETQLRRTSSNALYTCERVVSGIAICHRLRLVCGGAERFKRKHPEVTVQLQVENTRRCCQAVTRGHVDIAIVGGEIPHDLAHLLQARRAPLMACWPSLKHRVAEQEQRGCGSW